MDCQAASRRSDNYGQPGRILGWEKKNALAILFKRCMQVSLLLSLSSRVMREIGLHEAHFTWAGTFVLEAAAALWPNENLALFDSACVPTTLFEIKEL